MTKTSRSSGPMIDPSTPPMDINTAPRDGTEILLFGRTEWEDYGDKNDPPVWVVGYFDDENSNGWVATTANPYQDDVHATHWYPLPAAPTTIKGV